MDRETGEKRPEELTAGQLQLYTSVNQKADGLAVTEVRGKWKLSGGREGDGGWVEDKKKQVKSLHSSRKAQDLIAGTSEGEEWRAEDRAGWESLRGGSSGQGCTPLPLVSHCLFRRPQPKDWMLPFGRGWTKRGERWSPFGFSLWSYPPLALSLASALFSWGSLSQGLSGSISFFSCENFRTSHSGPPPTMLRAAAVPGAALSWLGPSSMPSSFP